MTSKAGRQVGQFWFLSIVQHLKLALEIYTGHEVDILRIITQQNKLVTDDGNKVETRVFDVVAESAFLNDGYVSGICIEGLVLTHKYAHLMWNWHGAHNQLSTGVAVFDKMKLTFPNSQFDLGFTYPEGRRTPFAEIRKSGSDECWRTGRHLGDRMVQAPDYVPRAVFL